jgi:hypothetical protein
MQLYQAYEKVQLDQQKGAGTSNSVSKSNKTGTGDRICNLDGVFNYELIEEAIRT